VPHFQLVTTDGEAVVTVHLGSPDWPPDSVIFRGGAEANLRVVDRLASNDPEAFSILVVEEITEDNV
jgi:hypothetical protein